MVIALGQALEENSSRFSALTHTFVDILADRIAAGEVAPMCYNHLAGCGTGLVDYDPRWASILEPDSTGFKGLTVLKP